MVKSLKEYSWQCKCCNKIFRVRKDLQNHFKEYPTHRVNCSKLYNKYTCEYCKKEWTTTIEGYKHHLNLCKHNPNKKSHCWVGKHHTQETKEKLSKSMQKAHKEGRAWNIGKSRWNNKMSYPEEFFAKVIKNEFIDQNYIHEYPFGIYSLDFAWVDKKKCVEIDGDQHQRFQEYIERDKRKDEYIKDQKWQVLRITWKDMFHDTKKWIKLAKDFIDN